MKPQMVTLRLDGQTIEVVEGTTLLEAAQFLGIEIPTLCSMDGLTPYGACRLCIVEIGPEERPKVVSSCTYPCEEGLEVRTSTPALLDHLQNGVLRSKKDTLDIHVHDTVEFLVSHVDGGFYDIDACVVSDDVKTAVL